MFRYLLPHIFLFAAYISFAQSDSSSIKHNSDSLIKLTVVGNGKYKSVVYTTANNTVLSRQEIKGRLLSYQPSAIEFQKFRTSKVFFGVFTGAALTSLIVVGIAHNNMATAKTAAYFSAGFLLGEIVSGLILVPHHFDKSIKAYNQQFL